MMIPSAANAAILPAILILANLTIYAIANKSEFTYFLDEGYPIGKKLFGNIAGVDVDKSGNVIIFHRGSHKWGTDTFNENDVYKLSKSSPITEETVVTIDPSRKTVLRAWGQNIFFMPHGLSLDLESRSLWLTDVALHQVFKYSLDGSKRLIELGTPFVPGNDEYHFCKPTSVADTGEFIFVADGYCNSRVVMFSANGKYIGEFGQSPDAAYLTTQSVQPIFNIPHKITYAKEAKMLCVADRENGRIQCFGFEPRRPDNDSSSRLEDGVLLNGAIKPKFVIADPLFNGRLFSLDYSPIRGGIIVAVSGEDLYDTKKPPLGFVYNVTTGQLLSRFSPPNGLTFGMAHDLAITGDEANSLYVVDITPVNLWRFSRPIEHPSTLGLGEIGSRMNQALQLTNSIEKGYGFFGYVVILSIIGTLLFVVSRTRKNWCYNGSTTSFATPYSNSYPTSINSLFGGGGRFPRRANGTLTNGKARFFNTIFSRRAFTSMFDGNRQQNSEFSRIPLEESDDSDNDKSDSDVEEFNITQENQGGSSVKITV